MDGGWVTSSENEASAIVPSGVGKSHPLSEEDFSDPVLRLKPWAKICS